jgi:two-component system cell cycle sensor histidine kinase/response regulator CckA
VEDEDGARKGLRAMLILLGYDVVAEGSAEEAGKLPEYPPFDLLLPDVVLPGATGHELSRGLVDRWPALKVILMSGYMEDEALREVIANGGVRFLRKPFDMATLAREVRVALDESTS